MGCHVAKIGLAAEADGQLLSAAAAAEGKGEVRLPLWMAMAAEGQHQHEQQRDKGFITHTQATRSALRW